MASELDLFAIGSWSLFDHIFKISRYPEHGETVPLDMPIERVEQIYFGDCSANLAAAAARLGVKVGLGMVVGDDFVNSGFRDHLLRMGVDVSGVEVVGDRTSGHTFLFSDPTGDGFNFSHLGIAEDQASWKIPENEIASARCVVVNEKFSEYTLSAIRFGKESGAITAINGMIATAGKFTRDFLMSTDILFISEPELDLLLAQLGFSSVMELHRMGPKTVFATYGRRGSRIHSENGLTEIQAVSAETVVDPTGAGDAYAAGTLTGILKGYSHEQAAKIGATVSSFVVEKWGCQTNLPDWAQVKARYHKVFGMDLDSRLS